VRVARNGQGGHDLGVRRAVESTLCAGVGHTDSWGDRSDGRGPLRRERTGRARVRGAGPSWVELG
jgi:hypothetical protein